MNEARPLHLTVITGLSGAGKSEAVATFEDTGYFCIDNLPPQMLPRVVELFCLEGSRVDRLALVFDVRAGTYFEQLGQSLEYLRQSGVSYRLLYLEASDEALVARYQSTRRPHPLSRSSPVQGIQRERALLSALREQADVVIDTTELSPRALRRRLEETLMAEQLSNQLFLSLVSFGYKFGLPREADLVLDSRFLPNPHWVPELCALNGLDEAVAQHVMGLDGAEDFVDRVVDLVHFLGPRFLSEQKPRVILAIGCTGGHHRSPVLIEELAARLRDDPGVVLSVSHRDLDRTV